jgi:hypothetical protein
MKNLIRVLIPLSLFLVISCTEKEKARTEKNPEVPEALQEKDDYSLTSSKRYSEDLVEKLYQEEVEKNAELQKLEKDLDSNPDSLRKTNDIFNKYNYKSTDYYLTAQNKLSSVKDSLLRKRIMAIVEKSNKNYEAKNAGIVALMKTIEKNNSSIEDQHTVLKVLVTLPLIEKYQDSQRPDRKAFEKQIREQEKLQKKLQSTMD